MPARTAPFRHLLAPAPVAAVSAMAAMSWIVAGDLLPGGRWLAVHLFTLGVVTPLIAMFTLHFAATVLHVERPATGAVLGVLAVGAATVVVARPLELVWGVATGATVSTVAITAGYVLLRRMRKRSIGARFRFVTRAYERAHGAFIHGAILGALLAVGVLPGHWHLGVRLAHLHVNVLGWAGLTLLATLVFFGPTVFRVRIAEGAEDRAVPALRWFATAVTGAAFALIATGVGGEAGPVLRVVAAGALAVAAVGAAAILRPVLAVARGSKTTLSALLIRDACVWFVVGMAVDVVTVGAGAWRWLDVAGLTILVGALATAIVGALTYLAPMLRQAEPRARVAFA